MPKKTTKKTAKKKAVKKVKSGVKTTLIITEKPQAAAKIAAALSGNTDEKFKSKEGVAYYNFQRDGKDYLVGCAVGHLFGIQQIAARGPFPNFEVKWMPNHTRGKSAGYTKKYYDTLKRLVKESDEFIVATDFDVEGEVIGWNVVRFIGGKKAEKEAKRMKFSSLTQDELEQSFKNLLPEVEWSHAYAGETRHYLDWFYGINLSRGLMKALSKTGQFRILSIGRVQGPSLKIVVDKEKEIEKFKAEPFWQVFLQVQDLNKNKAEVKYPKDLWKDVELKKFGRLRGKLGEASTQIKEEQINPPLPLDLTTLQTEAYKKIGLTPKQSLQVAQGLYLAGVISYPRTSSQEYPASIGYDKILKKLKKYTQLVKYATHKKPTKGKKKDPAHPAIYPTGETKKLSGTEKKLYDLIVKRFIACFCDPAIADSKRINVEVNGLKFYASGKVLKEKGWMKVYKKKFVEEELPIMNGQVTVNEIRTEEKMTQPPRRYSAASLVRELEKRGLGTKATRAGIVDTLSSRGYVTGKSLEATELGMRMADTLDKYSPVILDDKLTKEMEEKIEGILEAKSNFDEKEKKILEEAKKNITHIASELTENIDEIGKSLADANEAVWEAEREKNTMSLCPVCNKGNLRIMYGRKFGRYFVSCDAYPKCKTTYSLPPKGVMKPSRVKNEEGEEELEFCSECGFPLIVSFRKGSRPWKFCFNPECKTNEEVQKKKEEFKRKLASGEIKIDRDGKVVDESKDKD